MHRLPHIMYLCMIASVALAIDASAYVRSGDEPALLRVRLAKGASYRYGMSMTTSQDMTVAMNDISNESTSSMTMSMVVNDATIDRADITSTLSDVTTSVRVRGMDDLGVSRDTTMRLSQFDGVVMRFTIDQFGRASKVSTSLDGNASAFVSSMKVFERFSSYLPKEALPVGGTWVITTNDTTAAPTGSGDVRTMMTMQYTYRGIRDTLGTRCWVIDASSTGLTQAGDITANGIELELEGSGQSSGRTFLDVANGMIVAGYGTVAMQTQMSLSGQQSMVVPVVTQISYTLSRVSERR